MIQPAELVVSLSSKRAWPCGSENAFSQSLHWIIRSMPANTRLKIAVVGTGISGLSAAWLLSQRHDVTVYERADRIGGHSNTILASVGGRSIPVDTGFIVFNRRTYPNLTALFELLEVPTQVSEMSFAVSMDGGALEYSGSGLSGVFGQPRNLIRPRFWSMLADLVRFYRQAPLDADSLDDEQISLGDYLPKGQYGEAFRDDHLLPMASAIWSATPAEMLSYPAAAFIRFHDNHGLLQLSQRPAWETVVGGSRNYVERLTRSFADRIRLDTGVREVRRISDGVIVTDSKGHSERYDHVVMASHADQALAMLSRSERRGARSPRCVSLQPQSRGAAHRRQLHAEATGGVVKLELYRLSQCRARRRLRDLLDEPPAEHRKRKAAVRYPQSAAAAACRNAAPQRGLRSSDLRCEGDRRSAKVVASARQAEHLVLRCVFRRGLSRRRIAGGTRCRRAARRRAPAVAGAERVRTYRAYGENDRRESIGAADMTLRSSLYVGSVMHRRLQPRMHSFRYRAFWFLLDLDELAELSRRLRWFSHNRPNVFSLYDTDHGDGTATPLRAQVERQLGEAGVDLAGGRIRLLCMPRTLGYCFNPLSIFFCYRADGTLAALVYQVHNTFGERHSYVIRVEDQSGALHQHCRKLFYVSPFLDMDLRYDFRITGPDERIAVGIRASSSAKPVLHAVLTGARRDLTDRNL